MFCRPALEHIDRIDLGVYTAFFGRHAHFATPESTIQYFKQLYALQIVYPIAIFCIKISIILFYRRIFSISQTFKPLLLLGLIVSAWSVATVTNTMKSTMCEMLIFGTHRSSLRYLTAYPSMPSGTSKPRVPASTHYTTSLGLQSRMS